jgi:hypothetical protein
VVAVDGIRPRADIESPLDGGEYGGGHVITLLLCERQMYFMIPPEMMPLLKPHMDAVTFEDVKHRTLRLQLVG